MLMMTAPFKVDYEFILWKNVNCLSGCCLYSFSNITDKKLKIFDKNMINKHYLMISIVFNTQKL